MMKFNSPVLDTANSAMIKKTWSGKAGHALATTSCSGPRAAASASGGTTDTASHVMSM
jgi:hypothetical protein